MPAAGRQGSPYFGDRCFHSMDCATPDGSRLATTVLYALPGEPAHGLEIAQGSDAGSPLPGTGPTQRAKESLMGDKGGRKGKEKSHKQEARKQKAKKKDKEEKQPKSKV